MERQKHPVLDVGISPLLERLEYIHKRSQEAQEHAHLSSDHFAAVLKRNDALWDYLLQLNGTSKPTHLTQSR